NADGTLLPGLTVNAEIEVSRRDDVLRVSNAALRYRPSDAGGAGPGMSPGRPTQAPRAGAPGGGLADDLAQEAAALDLAPQQQAHFDQAVAAIRERQQARSGAPRGGTGGPPGMGGGGGGMQAQIRQRMAARMQEDFASFRASLDDAQRSRWDAALAALLNARRGTLYRLVDGQPQPVMVRLGATDGSFTEVSGGGLAEGDLIITGERARP